MIWESWPWKAALLTDAHKLGGLVIGEDDDEAAVEFERSIFLAGFTIRKLLEARKLTDRLAVADVKCLRYPLIDHANIPDRMNKDKFHEFYDLSGAKSGTAKLEFLANQLIHSFIFAAIVTDGGSAPAEGIFVNSDYDRSRFLYRYELAELIRIMQQVGNDEVVLSKSTLNENGEWVTRNYGANDPEGQ